MEGDDQLRQPEWIGSCRWSPSVTKKTIDLTLNPVGTFRHNHSVFSVDRKGGTMLRVEIDREESFRPTFNELSRPLPLSTNLSPIQKEIVDRYAIIRHTHKNAQSAKVCFGRLNFLQGWRERCDKKNKQIHQKRTRWRRLSLHFQRILNHGYHLGNDDTNRDGEAPQSDIMSSSQAIEQTRTTEATPIKIKSSPTVRPLSPWDPFGIMSLTVTGVATAAKIVPVPDGDEDSQNATRRSDPSVAAPFTISPTPLEKDATSTWCYSPTSKSEYLMYRNTLLLTKPMLIDQDAPDPDLVIISDDDTDKQDHVVEVNQQNDQEIEMIFETDSDIVVSSHPSHIREFDSPRGLAQLFGCWNTHHNMELPLLRDDNEAKPLVLDSYSADNSVEDKPLPTQSTREFVPIEQIDGIVAGTTPPLIPNPKKHRKAQKIRQKWAVIDILSENITDLLRCGPSFIEKKKMRQKKMEENDANLLGIFVKRNVEGDLTQSLSQYRSPSSVTMSDVVQ
ncbi:hypothetical protein FisN_27Lh091 [Fistulifera solaris]|uniref:Uncharacterized protein n=1 Tax=Fistulifera solaris TaxID=1519565 RepID=A0A1Z5KAN6_FISSO|nr:hypothetical protein FisN_27Lh091 [Fistulifera solaris]|eukprot:GAX23317.1 hypothetical protein FisN_27Lh091 [Fistulifera solaris]